MTGDDWKWLAGAAVVALLIVLGVASMVHAAPYGGNCGNASWYSYGYRTASGEKFNPNAMTAASPYLPFGTNVRVTDQMTGRSVVVRIDDRGPAAWTRRIIDLSQGAAARLGIINRGVAPVCVEPAE